MHPQNLAEEHLYLAELIAFDYAKLPGCPWDEARSEASLALMRAADAFDPAKGEFIPFSAKVIRNALNSLYAKQLRLLKIFPKSIDGPIDRQEPERNLEAHSDAGDLAGDPREDVRKHVRHRETSSVVDSLMNLLSPRERSVIEALRIGTTYSEIGTSLGISKQAAHKSGKAGITKLRTGLNRLGYRGIASDGNLASQSSRKTPP